MVKFDNIDSSMNIRVMDPAEMQAKIDDNKPDGYKLMLPP